MYDVTFPAAYSGSDWAVALEIIDATTNQPMTGLEDMLVEIVVNDDCDSPVLKGSTDDGMITIPDPGVLQWRFPKERLSGFCRGRTYDVGCRVTNEGGTRGLFIGKLPFLDGEFR